MSHASMAVMNLVILLVFAGFLAGLLILMLEADDNPIMYTCGVVYDLVDAGSHGCH